MGSNKEALTPSSSEVPGHKGQARFRRAAIDIVEKWRSNRQNKMDISSFGRSNPKPKTGNGSRIRASLDVSFGGNGRNPKWWEILGVISVAGMAVAAFYLALARIAVILEALK